MATETKSRKKQLDVAVITEKVVTFEVELPYWDAFKQLAQAIVDYDSDEIPDQATVEIKDTSIVVTWVEKNVLANMPDR